MMKKKTWNAGCMILISLMICTILSIRIEKWMQIPVEIATISQTEEEKLNSTIRIPKSCYNTDTNMIFYLPVGVGQPTLKVDNLTVGGTA